MHNTEVDFFSPLNLKYENDTSISWWNTLGKNANCRIKYIKCDILNLN